jgi:hypothetical protein
MIGPFEVVWSDMAPLAHSGGGWLHTLESVPASPFAGDVSSRLSTRALPSASAPLSVSPAPASGKLGRQATSVLAMLRLLHARVASVAANPHGGAPVNGAVVVAGRRRGFTGLAPAAADGLRWRSDS